MTQFWGILSEGSDCESVCESEGAPLNEAESLENKVANAITQQAGTKIGQLQAEMLKASGEAVLRAPGLSSFAIPGRHDSARDWAHVHEQLQTKTLQKLLLVLASVATDEAVKVVDDDENQSTQVEPDETK